MPKDARVTVAVCGKFHMLNYLPDLAVRGRLERFYMSHKPATARSLGLAPGIIKNFPAKEYLIQAHGRLPYRLAYENATLLYQFIWEQQVLYNWSPTRILHLLAQGAGSRLAKRANEEESIILCEVVNTHPQNRLALMQKEADHYSLNWRKSLLRREENLLEEVDRAHALLAPSKHVARTFRDRGISIPIHVIPYAANIKRFVRSKQANPSSTAPLRIIAVGQIGLRKGQLRLLDMLDYFGKAIEITLVGNIDSEVKPLLSRYQGRFDHHKKVPNTEMPGLLSRHDVFISTSLEEGLAVSICEAMAMGLCIVATRESGADEIVEDGRSGVLIDARDQIALKQTIEMLVDQREYCQFIGATAHQRTQEFVNWATYTEKLVALYDAL